MSKLPKKCIVDTNVPKTANKVFDPPINQEDLDNCILACIEAIDHVITKKGLVMDAGGEIYDEYCKQLSLSKKPGIGNSFMKWVHDHRWTLPDEDRVSITKKGDSYDEFPNHEGLSKFDKSDRKFIAVANAHPKKPKILQATDSKWVGWNQALEEVGISVQFLCPDYVKAKYKEKFGT